MRDLSRLVVSAVSIAGISAALLSGQGGLVANAGPDQSGVFVNSTVFLDGSASTGETTYAWTITTRPTGSVAALQNASSVNPTFIPDKRGSYTVKLKVGNGSGTFDSDTLVITTANRPPVANAGPDVAGAVKSIVALTGAASSDPDNDKLTYLWAIVDAPVTSVGLLSSDTVKLPNLTLDRPGTFLLSLVVHDGQLSSAPDLITITTTNTAPISNAGPDRKIVVGVPVQLNGTGSTDVDEDVLTYAWSLTRPSGSSAILDDPSSSMPSFVPDQAGTYTATLTVDDGTVTAQDSVVLGTSKNFKPIARSGPDERPLTLGATLQLDGSGSMDANGQQLAYKWTVTKRPSGSSNSLVGGNKPRPTFTADKAGNYTFSLAVTDPGTLVATDPRLFSSSPGPLAHAGVDQAVEVGSTVTLDGSRSSHFSKAIAFGWALVSAPEGSTAELDDPTDPQPQFVADLEGTYVAQLILFDGTKWSAADTVTVSTNGNLPPVTDLGPDRVVTSGVTATLDALATDPNLDPLLFRWAVLWRPAGSTAGVSSTTGPTVQLTPDVAGDYIVQVTATDPGGLSSLDTLLLTTGNTSPTVVAEDDRLVEADVPVVAQADADDPDGGPIAYEWRMLRLPPGSAATLNNPTSATPTFTPDVPGAYLVQVVVKDAMRLFAIDSVVYRVLEGPNEPPVANAGPDQIVGVGGLAQLEGGGSSDPENQNLTYQWTFVSKPFGSTAALSSDTAESPTFTADVAGEYELQLVVNDGVQDSAPDTVFIRTPLQLSLSPSALSVNPNGGTGQLTLTAAYEPSANLVVQLTSSNPNVATVPATATILANTTSVNFNVTGGATNGGVIITASAAGAGAGHATVAVGSTLRRWNVDASGDWFTPANWTPNGAPGPGDVVVIDRPAGAFTVTINAATAAVASVYAAEALNIAGNFTVNGAAALDGGVNLTGAMSGTGSAAIGSAMTWGSGTIQLGGGVEVLQGHTLTFPNNGQSRILAATSLINRGTVAMGHGNSVLLQGATTVAVSNEATGLWTLGDSNIVSNGNGALTFNNAGILRKTTGSGQAQLLGFVDYTSTGTIDVMSGSIAVAADGANDLVHSGHLNLANGTTFFLNDVTLLGGATFSGGGTLNMNGITTVTGALTIPVTATLSGTLQGTGSVDMDATMTWGSGTISLSGGLEILQNRTLTFLENGQSRILIGTSLTNRGTVAMGHGNSLLLNGGSTVAVSNEATGLWTFGDSNITSNGNGTLTFSNAGILRKTTGAGQAQLVGWIDYTNTGTIDVLSGTMAVAAEGANDLSHSGHMSLAAGTTFFLSDVTLVGGATFGGSGALNMNGVTTVTGSLTIPLATTLAGTLQGSGSLDMDAAMTWGNGTISLSGGLEILQNRTLTFPDNGQSRILISTSLINRGTVAMGHGNSLLLNGGSTVAVSNEATGLWTFGDSNITSNGNGTLTFSNAGILRKTTGAGQAQLLGWIDYTNTGTIQVQSGTMAVSAEGTNDLSHSGHMSLTAGTTFFLNDVTLVGGATFSGGGALNMNGLTTVTGNLTIPLSTTLGGALQGTGSVDMDAAMTWTNGTISLSGGLEVLQGRTLTLPNNGQSRLLQGTSLTNRGTVAMGHGNTLMLIGATTVVVNNEATGLWTLGDSWITSNGAGTLSFTNAGILRKTTGAGQAQLLGWIDYTNTGTIEVQSGTMAVSAEGANDLSHSGHMSLTAGTTFFLSDVTLVGGATFSGGGALHMNGITTVSGNVSIPLATTLSQTLTGTGNLTMTGSLAWTQGVVSLVGELRNAATSTLTLGATGQLRQLNPGTTLRNFGTFNWTDNSTIFYQPGANVAIVNEAGALWSFGTGNYTVQSNGAPSPPGTTFTVTNAGTMQGPGGNPATVLTVAQFVSFTNTGAISGMTVLDP